MLRVHRLPPEQLDEIAVGGGVAQIERLRTVSHTRQLHLLRSILDRSPEESAELGRAWDVLVAAERQDAGAVDLVLSQPQVGLWSGRTLRALADGSADLGYLRVVAAAAAVRAGIPFRLPVPVRDGTVVFPTLGMLTLPERGSPRAEVEVWAGTERTLVDEVAELPRDYTRDAPGWLPMRRLQVTAGQTALEVWLDDLDPQRGFLDPVSPARLSGAELARWSEALAAAWSLLVASHPRAVEELRAGLTVLVPVTAGPEPYSGSNPDAFGCVAMSLPPDAANFAVTLVHEVQHSKLGALLELVELVLPGGDRQLLHAPWRPDPRPLPGVLHGTYSFLRVTEFWRIHRHVAEGPEARLAEFEFAYWRAQTWQATRALAGSAALTEAGRRFVGAMEERLASWQDEPVPAGPAAAAELATAGNRALWRLRHLRPPPDAVGALLAAWRTGRPPPRSPAVPELVPSTDFADELRLDVLVRMELADPVAFRLLRPGAVPGSTLADLALVAGDREVAVEGYRRRLLADPASVTAWAGLASALSGPAAAALLDRPELCRAGYRELAGDTEHPVDPVGFAEWLGA